MDAIPDKDNEEGVRVMGRKKRRPAPVVGLNSDSETVGNRLTVERENELLVEENIRLLARVRALEDALQGIRRS